MFTSIINSTIDEIIAQFIAMAINHVRINCLFSQGLLTRLLATKKSKSKKSILVPVDSV